MTSTTATATTANRETWLNQLAAHMAPTFEKLGHPLPAFRASIGWPSAGKDAAVTGECWDKRVSGDGHFEIFISPGRDDSQAIACTLAHELIHAAVGLAEGHKGAFAKVALELGFARPLTHASAVTPEKLAAWVDPMLEKVGRIPHAAIASRRLSGMSVKRGGGGIVPANDGAEDGDSDNDGDDNAAPINTRPKPQTGRLLKACCTAEDCGYTVRVTAKWLEVGPPHCPLHGAMQVDGAGD